MRGQCGAVAAVGGRDLRVQLAHRLLQLPAAEGRAEIDGVAVPLEYGRAHCFPGDVAHHPFGQVHHLGVRGVGLVQLQHGELGVVAGGHAFVAEVAVDLVDALQPADHQALEVELRRHPQEQLQVQRVVVGHERARGGAAGDVLHHRRFHFEEAARVQPVADRADDARAGDEDFARLRGDDQVDIALAVALLDIAQAVELVRQRPQRLHQQPQRRHLDRELTGLGAHQPAFRGHDVADVPALERLVRLTQHVGLQEQLDPAAHVLDGGERRLAHDALCQDAAGDCDGTAIGFQHFPGPALGVRILRLQVAGKVRATEIIRVGASLPTQRGQLGTALGDQVVFVDGLGGGGFVHG